MNKIIIPSIFVAVLLTAGFFAVMPVEKVSAVHTTLLSTLCKALFNLTTCPTTQTSVLSSGGTLGADSITAATIATGAIGADEIAAGAITSSEAPNLDAAVSSRSTPGDVNEKDASYSATIAGAGTFVVVAAEAGKSIRGQAVIAETSGVAATTCALQDTGGTVLIAAVGPGASGVAFIESGVTAGFSVGEGLQVVSVTAGVRCSLAVNLDSVSG